MIVYHGSDREIALPDVNHSRPKVDFGPGFYVTPLWKQVEKWASRFQQRGRAAVVTEYELDDEALTLPRTLRFDAYNEAWLDFIVACRSGKTVEGYDLVMGSVANDRVFDTIELFFDGLIDKAVAIQRLKFYPPNYQICIRSQAIIDRYLHFVGSKVL